RPLEGAVPVVLKATEDNEPAVRGAALHAIGVLGTEKEAGDLAALLRKTDDATARTEIEEALLAITGRKGAACAPKLIGLEQCSDSGLRIIGLHVLASAGGPEALDAVKSALEDKTPEVQDEAVRTLSSWPNTWPDD